MISPNLDDVVVIHFHTIESEQAFPAKIIKIYSDLVYTHIPLIKFRDENGEEGICCSSFILEVIKKSSRTVYGSEGFQRIGECH